MGSRRQLTFFIFAILTLACLPTAAAIGSVTNELNGLPIRDPLNRGEGPLANEAKWTPFTWVENVGAETLVGWKPQGAYTKGSGGFWNPSSFSAKGAGNAVVAELGQISTNEETFASLWLDMPDPKNAKSGYQLVWRINADKKTYTVELLRWSKGTSTVLKSNSAMSSPKGKTIALSNIAETVQVWLGTPSELSVILSTTDSTYTSGYSGLQARGTAARLANFKTGDLLGSAPTDIAVLDNLERSEVPLAAPHWSKAIWAEEIGGVYNGAGWLGFGGFDLAVAYWNAATFSSAGNGSAVSARIGSLTAVETESESERISMWLNMPTPASTQSGYEVALRWSSGAYRAELSKCVGGSCSILASASKVAVEKGQLVALTDAEGGLTFWMSAAGGYLPILTAYDSDFLSGYAGLETLGPEGTLYAFRAGSL